MEEDKLLVVLYEEGLNLRFAVPREIMRLVAQLAHEPPFPTFNDAIAWYSVDDVEPAEAFQLLTSYLVGESPERARKSTHFPNWDRLVFTALFCYDRAFAPHAGPSQRAEMLQKVFELMENDETVLTTRGPEDVWEARWVRSAMLRATIDWDTFAAVRKEFCDAPVPANNDYVAAYLRAVDHRFE